MSVTTYVGVVHKGKIVLKDAATLPDGSQVYVVVPDLIDEKTARRQANRWLIELVGNMVMADDGQLNSKELEKP